MLVIMFAANRTGSSRTITSVRNALRRQGRIGGRILALGLSAGLAAELFTGCASRSPAAAAASVSSQDRLTLQILDPSNVVSSTTRGFANILGRTSPEAKVEVGGETARLFATGIFVRDQVPLKLGENQIKIVATARDGQKLERIVTLNRTEEAVAPPRTTPEGLEIRPDTIRPSANVFLAPGDVLELGLRGTPGQAAEFRLAGLDWQPMTEAMAPEAGKPSGLYRATLVATTQPEVTAEPVQFRLRPASNTKEANLAGAKEVAAASSGKVGFWDQATLRLAQVSNDGAGLSFGMHEVRLGGPYLAELPAGTLLRVTGMQGDNYRVRLSPDFEAWIARRDVEWAPPGTPAPHLSFTDLSAYGDKSVDYVSIPYPARIPFSVTPATSPAGRAAIDVDFFGAHNAATWISHRPTAKAVREVTVRQVATDHVRVRVELHARQLWGYQWSVTNNAFRLTVRRPPLLASAPESPLKGLTIALEPGHGGSNSGAGGVSGTQEKDINRMAVAELARQFQAAGAQTVIVRPDDEAVPLSERTRRAIAANANVFISVHANSAGHTRGYLSVSGTSTYYKWSFSRDLAEAIHARLLADTQLNDFGNVGNFNYYPIRQNTWMPSMLVEQAFMSNPEDEAKMLDPDFRRTMMRAVVRGTQDWLQNMRVEAAR